jgi:hypothetical protein
VLFQNFASVRYGREPTQQDAQPEFPLRVDCVNPPESAIGQRIFSLTGIFIAQKPSVQLHISNYFNIVTGNVIDISEILL